MLAVPRDGECVHHASACETRQTYCGTDSIGTYSNSQYTQANNLPSPKAKDGEKLVGGLIRETRPKDRYSLFFAPLPEKKKSVVITDQKCHFITCSHTYVSYVYVYL